MESLDKLIIASIDNEKALGDFKVELSNILCIPTDDIEVKVGTSLLHSTIAQKLIVKVYRKSEFTNNELNQIPFDELVVGAPVLFIFDIGEASI